MHPIAGSVSISSAPQFPSSEVVRHAARLLIAFYRAARPSSCATGRGGRRRRCSPPTTLLSASAISLSLTPRSSIRRRAKWSSFVCANHHRSRSFRACGIFGRASTSFAKLSCAHRAAFRASTASSFPSLERNRRAHLKSARVVQLANHRRIETSVTDLSPVFLKTSPATALLPSIVSGMAARPCTVRIHSHIAIFAFFPRRSPPYRPLSEIT
jgi:hypothetical protein